MKRQPLSGVLLVQRLHPDAYVPERGSEDAAGLDLHAAEPRTIAAGDRDLVSIGIAVAIPKGSYGRVAPRSGLAVEQGITIGAGVIDSDYRGELKVLLFNHGEDALVVKKGDRIAQLIIEKIDTVHVQVAQ